MNEYFVTLTCNVVVDAVNEEHAKEVAAEYFKDNNPVDTDDADYSVLEMR